MDTRTMSHIEVFGPMVAKSVHQASLTTGITLQRQIFPELLVPMLSDQPLCLGLPTLTIFTPTFSNKGFVSWLHNSTYIVDVFEIGIGIGVEVEYVLHTLPEMHCSWAG